PSGLRSPAAEVVAGGGAHHELVGARDAVEGGGELPAVVGDRGPVQGDLGVLKAVELARFAGVQVDLGGGRGAVLDRTVLAFELEAFGDVFALQAAVGQLDLVLCPTGRP